MATPTRHRCLSSGDRYSGFTILSQILRRTPTREFSPPTCEHRPDDNQKTRQGKHLNRRAIMSTSGGRYVVVHCVQRDDMIDELRKEQVKN